MRENRMVECRFWVKRKNCQGGKIGVSRGRRWARAGVGGLAGSSRDGLRRGALQLIFVGMEHHETPVFTGVKSISGTSGGQGVTNE